MTKKSSESSTIDRDNPCPSCPACRKKDERFPDGESKISAVALL